MQTLASAWDAIAARAARADALAIGLDFDGTLTPIQGRPEHVVLAPSTRAVLQRLAEVPGITVAVVSGRALIDLDMRLAVPGVILIGNHGFERKLPDGPSRYVVDGIDLDAVHSAARVLAGVAAGVEGAWLEDKGPTLSLHHRQVAPDMREGLVDTVRAVAATFPSSIYVKEGRCVFDVRPTRPAVTKGSALCEAFMEAGVPDGAMRWYFGDDATDEDVFTTLPDDAVTVRVSEDDTRRTAARYVASDPGEVVFLLDAVRKTVEDRHASDRREGGESGRADSGITIS